MSNVNYAEMARLVKLGRRTEKRREALGKLAKNFVSSLTTLVFDAWFFMLAVGVTSHEWLHGLPTIGYWWSVLLIILLRGTFSSRVKEVKEVAS